MKLTVELQAYLLQYSPDEVSVFEYEMPEGSTVTDLANKLGVPPELASVIIVSDEATTPRHVLVDGDRVTLVPPMAGGVQANEGTVTAVSRSAGHTMSKPNQGGIRLIAGLGVEGDAHAGQRVKHRSRIARDPSQPNLRQVHLIHSELHDELRASGFDLSPGQVGENITTRGVDLLRLPVGTRLWLGEAAVVEVTGLRNPCAQLDGIQEGLMKAVLDRDANGDLIRKAGVMGVVVAGGVVRPGDAVRVELPPAPRRALAPV